MDELVEVLVPPICLGIVEIRAHGHDDVVANCHIGEVKGILDKIIDSLLDIVLLQCRVICDRGAAPFKAETRWRSVLSCSVA